MNYEEFKEKIHGVGDNTLYSAITVLVMFGLAFLMIVYCLVFPQGAHAQEEYSDEEIVQAIYKAEGGEKASKPFGILSVNCDGINECRKICLNTVKANRRRFVEYGHRKFKYYLSFLAARYAPVAVGNDRKGLNQYWLKNVKFFLARNRQIASVR